MVVVGLARVPAIRPQLGISGEIHYIPITDARLAVTASNWLPGG